MHMVRLLVDCPPTLGSGRVSLLGLLDPVIGVLAAQAVLGETLSALQWVGLAVAVGACGALPWVRGAHGKASIDDNAIAVAPVGAVFAETTMDCALPDRSSAVDDLPSADVVTSAEYTPVDSDVASTVRVSGGPAAGGELVALSARNS